MLTQPSPGMCRLTAFWTEESAVVSLTTIQEAQIAAMVGLGRWDLMVTYDPAKRRICTQLPEGGCVTEVREKLGKVVKSFTMRQDLMDGSRSYYCGRTPIYTYENFSDESVFSVTATDDNVKNLMRFLLDREDHKSAKKLRAHFPELFPRRSRIQQARNYLFGTP
jgi:hypothetical protein